MSFYAGLTLRSSRGCLTKTGTKRLRPSLTSQVHVSSTQRLLPAALTRSNHHSISRPSQYYANTWSTKLRERHTAISVDSISNVYCRSISNAVKPKRKKGRRVNKRQHQQPPIESKKTTKRKSKLLGVQTDDGILRGPRGRPAMTEQCATENYVLQHVMEVGNMRTNHNPKVIMNAAKHRLGFDMDVRHRTVEGKNSKEQSMFVSTTTITLPNDDGILSIKDHPHAYTKLITNADDDWSGIAAGTSIEVVSLGVAPSKQRADMLSIADTLVLLYEMGIDCRDPPDIQEQRLRAAREAQALAEKQKELQEKAIFKADLAKAQMVLEIVNASKPTFETTKMGKRTNGTPSWVATASCFVGGIPLKITGADGSRKATAEGNAVIALANSKDVATIVGKDLMETYFALIEASPAKHIASLRIPPLTYDLLGRVRQSLGSTTDHESRVHNAQLMRDEYESRYQDRHIGKKNRSGSFRNTNLTSEKNASISSALANEEEARLTKATNNPNGKEGQMKAIRDALPIKAIQHDLIEALRTNQVVVVSGGTGSGKSTQCPQYILEDAIASGQGADAKIIVTQPRRIAAISVAERVAAERCERLGKSVGYTVRFKKHSPREYGGSIEFVTTGVLLRRLINDPELPGVQVIMIDEVHERDINTDFLLVLLRDLLKNRTDLRIVLMSATLDAESFSDYFSSNKFANGRAPLLSVPTQPRHPVEVFYLEDLIDNDDIDASGKALAQSLLRYNDEQLEEDLEDALEEDQAASDLRMQAQAEDEGGNLGNDSDDDDSDEEDSEPGSFSTITSQRVETLRRAMSMRHSEGIDESEDISSKIDPLATSVRLVTKVAQMLCREELDAGRSGSILCFLPGWDEIKAAMEELENDDPELYEKMTVLPLHSTIPYEDQQKVFQPANGKVKVILATNIAESSVTINDVLAVVDSGLVRELNYNAERAMNSMETNSTSRASATQRLGRAGRVAPGKCYRLFSRADHEAMPPRPTPEIKRTALEATCLQTCSMTKDGVEQFLSNALDPPPAASVSLAMERLVKLGAIDIKEDGKQALSPLGRSLSSLPLDPATGRMLIMGVVMKCLDPLITAAACFSSRNVFYNPPGLRDEAREIRQSFSEESDIIAMKNAYDKFFSIVEQQGWKEAKGWAKDRYVSIAAMSAIKAVRSQLVEELSKAGFIPRTDLVGRRKNLSLCFDADVNRNSDNEILYTALWAMAYPDNLAARRPQGSFGTLRTRGEDHAGLHPSSVTFHRKPPKDRRSLARWYMYQEMVLSSQIFLRSATGLAPEQVLLFGGYSLDPSSSKTEKASSVRGVIDDWIVVEGKCKETVDLLCKARQDINLALEQKVMFPREPIRIESQAILDTVCDVLDPSALEDEEEGMPGALKVDWWSNEDTNP